MRNGPTSTLQGQNRFNNNPIILNTRHLFFSVCVCVSVSACVCVCVLVYIGVCACVRYLKRRQQGRQVILPNDIDIPIFNKSPNYNNEIQVKFTVCENHVFHPKNAK